MSRLEAFSRSPWSLAPPLLVALCLGLLTLDGDFVYDDSRAIVTNPVVTGEAPAHEAFLRDFWGHRFGSGDPILSYRPLTPLLWRAVWGPAGDPLPFRSLTAVLFVACVGLFALIARRILEPVPAFLAALLFSAHGTHAEVVGALVSHADLLGACFGLAAMLLTLRADAAPGWRRGFSIAGTTLVACLFKESSFVFGLACVVLLAARGWDAGAPPWRRRLPSILPVASVLLAVVAVQLGLPRTVTGPDVPQSIVYWAAGAERLLLGLAFFEWGLLISFVPLGLAPRHCFGAWDLSVATLLPHAIAGCLLLAAAAGIVALRLRRRDTRALVLLTLLLAPVLLSSGLIVRVPNELPERLFLPATMAASAITAELLWRLLPGRRALWAAVAIAGWYLHAHVAAQLPWREKRTLMEFMVEREPKCMTTHLSYAALLAESGERDRAVWHAVLTAYIVKGFPRSLAWPPVLELEELALPERWLRAPAVLSPDDPCGFIRRTLSGVRAALPDLEPYAQQGWQRAHPHCFERTGGRRTIGRAAARRLTVGPPGLEPGTVRL